MFYGTHYTGYKPKGHGIPQSLPSYNYSTTTAVVLVTPQIFRLKKQIQNCEI